MLAGNPQSDHKGIFQLHGSLYIVREVFLFERGFDSKDGCSSLNSSNGVFHKNPNRHIKQIFGKDEVTGSNPVISSINRLV
ncbi:MAG: hypothetical protein J6K55_02915 [Clostridia bacterium]|nr:hypothetical protein [Clostridia bacterium]